MSDNDTPSYIDYEAFLSPSFSPYFFANSLVLGTNNPSDTTLDLSTPLSRVLFDVQEIDTHIHNLTTKSALPILEYVKERDDASRRILEGVEADVGKLRTSYERLEREVLARYEEAERARVASLRSLEVLRIGKAVGRAVALGRQLEIQIGEAGLGVPGRAGKEDHRAMVRAAYTVLEFGELLEQEEEGKDLQRVNVVKTLKTDLFTVVEERTRSKAQQIIREFSISTFTSTSSTTSSPPAGGASASTFLQTEDAKARTTSAITILYLLSPIPSNPRKQATEPFRPSLLLASLQTFLQNALTSSLASIARALTTLPTLDRTLSEVSTRCQNVVAMEVLLSGIKPPNHPSLPPTLSRLPEHDHDAGATGAPDPQQQRNEEENEEEEQSEVQNLLTPLLNSLDTPSLPSYFWRSLAGALSGRVQEILSRGGVSARTLRSNKNMVGAAIRECVMKGSELPRGVGGPGTLARGKGVGSVSWEREAAVMVGSVVGVLGR